MGPTNSGKTYHALKQLESSLSGKFLILNPLSQRRGELLLGVEIVFKYLSLLQAYTVVH